MDGASLTTGSENWQSQISRCSVSGKPRFTARISPPPPPTNLAPLLCCRHHCCRFRYCSDSLDHASFVYAASYSYSSFSIVQPRVQSAIRDDALTIKVRPRTMPLQIEFVPSLESNAMHRFENYRLKGSLEFGERNRRGKFEEWTSVVDGCYDWSV